MHTRSKRTKSKNAKKSNYDINIDRKKDDFESNKKRNDDNSLSYIEITNSKARKIRNSKDDFDNTSNYSKSVNNSEYKRKLRTKGKKIDLNIELQELLKESLSFYNKVSIADSKSKTNKNNLNKNITVYKTDLEEVERNAIKDDKALKHDIKRAKLKSKKSKKSKNSSYLSRIIDDNEDNILTHTKTSCAKNNEIKDNSHNIKYNDTAFNTKSTHDGSINKEHEAINNDKKKSKSKSNSRSKSKSKSKRKKTLSFHEKYDKFIEGNNNDSNDDEDGSMVAKIGYTPCIKENINYDAQIDQNNTDDVNKQSNIKENTKETINEREMPEQYDNKINKTPSKKENLFNIYNSGKLLNTKKDISSFAKDMLKKVRELRINRSKENNKSPLITEDDPSPSIINYDKSLPYLTFNNKNTRKSDFSVIVEKENENDLSKINKLSSNKKNNIITYNIKANNINNINDSNKKNSTNNNINDINNDNRMEIDDHIPSKKKISSDIIDSQNDEAYKTIGSKSTNFNSNPTSKTRLSKKTEMKLLQIRKNKEDKMNKANEDYTNYKNTLLNQKTVYSLSFKYSDLQATNTLLLPPSYKHLSKKFEKLVNSINNNRLRENLEFDHITKNTGMITLDFEQMLFVVPHLLVYKKIHVNAKNKSLLFVNIPHDFKDRLKTNYLKLNYTAKDFFNLQNQYSDDNYKQLPNSDKKEIIEAFKTNLLMITNHYHIEFCKKNNLKFNAIKSGTWHSSFNLEKDVESIPSFKLLLLEQEIGGNATNKIDDLLDSKNLSQKLFELNLKNMYDTESKIRFGLSNLTLSKKKSKNNKNGNALASSGKENIISNENDDVVIENEDDTENIEELKNDFEVFQKNKKFSCLNEKTQRILAAKFKTKKEIDEINNISKERTQALELSENYSNIVEGLTRVFQITTNKIISSEDLLEKISNFKGISSMSPKEIEDYVDFICDKFGYWITKLNHSIKGKLYRLIDNSINTRIKVKNELLNMFEANYM